MLTNKEKATFSEWLVISDERFMSSRDNEIR
jgi:hypothetical protein